ncbi:MAG: hypothetical protein WBM17_17280 [Anaerolineales bacterium]
MKCTSAASAPRIPTAQSECRFIFVEKPRRRTQKPESNNIEPFGMNINRPMGQSGPQLYNMEQTGFTLWENGIEEAPGDQEYRF